MPIVDCVIGGSPCQDLSVAGKRAGLEGERSGLFMEQIRITKEMRERDERNNGRSGEHIRPRFLLWENVPGAFSSNRGEDFRIVLEEIAKVTDKDAVIPMPEKNKWNTSGCIVGDGWSIAWRVLDAQFWGVPQRRRRIALVADFGGQCAQEVLFIRKSLRGDSEESGEKRKGSSANAQGCIEVYDRDGETSLRPLTLKIRSGCEGGGKGALIQDDKSAILSCNNDQYLFEPLVMESVVAFEPGAAQRLGGYAYEDVSGTLRSNMGDNQMSVAYSIENHPNDSRANIDESGKVQTLTSRMGTGGGNVPLILLDRSAYNQGENALYNIGIDEKGVAFSHIAKGPGAVCYIDTSHADDVVRTDNVVAPLQARDYKGGKYVFCVDQGGGKSGANVTEGLSPTLTCTHGGEPVICLQGNGIDRADTAGCNGKGWKEGTCYTLNTMDRPAVVYNGANITSPINKTNPQIGDACHTLTEDNRNYLVEIKPHYIVRRLTPLECERLQGYPDYYTDIGEYIDEKGKKKKSSDSARYKALGNSIALPPWKWVIKRLCSHYERDATMASLFDGIGGFPLIWEQINGKGSCLWASEIEDFPIAVTKARIE